MMVIRCKHLATLVVVTLTLLTARLTVIHCEQISQVDASNAKAEDLCPCLPVDICPRVFGAKPDDAKYLGDIKKCADVNTVRCCGASASFVVGKGKTIAEEPKVEENTAQSDILSRHDADVHENEISDAENESEILATPLSDRDENTGSSFKIAENIANFHSHQRLNGETDEEAAESESVAETATTDLQNEHQAFDGVEGSKEDGESNAEAVPTKIAPKSHRKPKTLDDVMMVYPNSMSGIPKTTPKNMPETNEMTMFDQDIGMDLHLVFSKTTIKPELPVPVELSSSSNSTKKRPLYQFAKRRRQYRPIQRVATESPVEDMELKPTTVRSRTVTRQSSRVRNFNLKSSTQEPTNSTVKPRPATSSTKVQTTEEKEEEILQTSDDDKSQPSRLRLFNARHRLNYLRRSTTTTTTTTTTTESPTKVTTRPTPLSRNLDKKRPSRVDESSSKNRISSRPSKMNETLVRIMDTDHRIMMSKVHVALKAAATENQIIEIPRSFASVEMNNRVKKIEEMLVSKMIDVYAETMTKRRGDQPRTKEHSEVRNNLQRSTTTVKPVPKPTSNSTRPFRGTKKFQMSDLLDKTLIVPMNPKEHKQRKRVRGTTTVKPAEQILEDAIVTTTRRSRRRPTTTIQPNILVQTLDEKQTNSRDSRIRVNKEENNLRRRVNVRRRFTTEPPTTTILPPVPTTTIQTTHPTISTTVTPDTTTLSQATTEFAIVSNKSDDDFEEELEDELTQTLQVIATTINPSTKDNFADSLSDFKPSPLWSITNDEKTDFNDREQNHSYDMDRTANEQTLRNGSRRSRNTHTFDPPVQYFNGFVPVTSFTAPIQIVGPIPKSNKIRDDTKVKYNLPRDSKAHFSKN